MLRVIPLLLAACFPRIEPPDENTRPSDTDSDTDADSDADTDADADSDTDVDAARIDAVDPADGSTLGGREVTIDGSGFDDRTRVWFDGSEASVLEVAEDRLVVEAPAHAAGTGDVGVGRDDEGDTLRDAWTWWPDATDQTEAFVLWYYLWDAYNTEPAGLYGLVFPIEPAEAEPHELWSPSLDQCGDSTLPGVEWNNPLALVDDAGDSYPFTLEAGSYDYADTGSGWDANASFGLAADAGSGAPAFQTDLFFEAPSSFTVTSPAVATLDYYIGGFPFDVAWSGTGDDFVLIWITSLSSDESLYCVARDDGEFDVPSAGMSRFESGDTLQVAVGRSSVGQTTLAHDNGILQGAGMYIVVGFITVF